MVATLTRIGLRRSTTSIFWPFLKALWMGTALKADAGTALDAVSARYEGHENRRCGG